MLNPDQQKSLHDIQRWYKGNQLNMVLDGKGGVGKSFLVDSVLKELDCNPIILAPTNEALKQVREKVTGRYPFRTIHSALGLSPTLDTKELKFEQLQLPSLWDEVDLAIIDECSMVGKDLLAMLTNIGIKILWVGHLSQLPPVEKELKVFDKCISPVFEKGWFTTTLTLPVRNTGELWDFNNVLDDSIYNGNNVIPTTFDVRRAEMLYYISSTEGKEDFLEGKTKIILWSNDGVDRLNEVVRKAVHGSDKLPRFLPQDKIILTAPMTNIEGLEHYSDSALKKVIGNKEIESLYSNSKADILQVEKTVVRLNKYLTIPCWKLLVDCEGEARAFYCPVEESDLEKVDSFYTHLAWEKKDIAAKKKAFRERAFILSCFAQIKHYFAATAYRAQGMSIDNVILIDHDIRRCHNVIMQKKNRYVGASRTRHRLMFHRGVI